MIKKALITLVLAIGLSLVKAQSINSEKSIVNFEVSNMGFNTVEGTFKGMTGEIVFDGSNLVMSSFKVCVDANTVFTENEKRDAHLKKEDFFNTSKFPTICFVSNSISKSEEVYVVKGMLEMHGITLKVEIPFTYENEIFKGRFLINRLDYKVGEGTGPFMVGNEVEMEIICVIKTRFNFAYLQHYFP